LAAAAVEFLVPSVF